MEVGEGCVNSVIAEKMFMSSVTTEKLPTLSQSPLCSVVSYQS